MCFSETICKWTKGLIGRLIWNWNILFSNSKMTRHLLISSKVLIVQKYLLEFNTSRKVLTIQEFSSDDLMDARKPPLSSHIFYIKSKIVNWLTDWFVVSILIYPLTFKRQHVTKTVLDLGLCRAIVAIDPYPSYRLSVCNTYITLNKKRRKNISSRLTFNSSMFSQKTLFRNFIINCISLLHMHLVNSIYKLKEARAGCGLKNRLCDFFFYFCIWNINGILSIFKWGKPYLTVTVVKRGRSQNTCPT